MLWAGGRWYRFGQRDTDPRHRHNDDAFRRLRASFERFFPQWAEVPFEYGHGGLISWSHTFIPQFGRTPGNLIYDWQIGDPEATDRAIASAAHVTEIEIHNPVDMPDPGEYEEVKEPIVKATVIVPKEFVGAIMELSQDKRGTFLHVQN